MTVFAAGLLRPLQVYAERPEVSAPASAIHVAVRVIEASDPLPNLPFTDSVRGSIDQQLEDLRGKLLKLHYRNFRLLGVQEEIVPLLQKESIALLNGQMLTVRPLYVSGKRIGLWLKWRDRGGVEVLDTRMHFDAGESMLTGTEDQGGKGVVLAINVRPER